VRKIAILPTIEKPLDTVDNAFKYRRGVGHRATDHLQHFGSCRLLLQRLGEFPRALLLRLEQPRVLNGDHRLVGEGGDQFYLLFVKWTHLNAGERKDANCRSVTQERHSKDRPEPECLLVFNRLVFGIG
jgi:hypothetical protein